MGPLRRRNAVRGPRDNRLTSPLSVKTLKCRLMGKLGVQTGADQVVQGLIVAQ